MSRVIWCETWMWPIAYGFCPDKAAWMAEMKKLNVVEHYPTRIFNGAACTEFDFHDKNNHYIVTIGSQPHWTSLGITCLLMHEAVHVFQHLCEAIGEKKPSSEFEAYTTAAISRELFLAYEKTRGKLFRGK